MNRAARIAPKPVTPLGSGHVLASEPRPCLWPEGDGRGIRFRCLTPALPGRSYCQAHCRRALLGFVRSPPSRPVPPG